ncbi:cation:proton antiporter, partial [Acinetobacter baumannii]|uniref:cation:proton antiporter domain-containing protein n=1 Tax=Acinetobacter baumannii TaxID=470 RepID=UPI003AF94584
GGGFLTVGMTTPVSLLIERPGLIIGGAIGLLVIKTLVLTAIARYQKYSWNNSLLLGTCLALGGEFAFVILSLAKGEKILTVAVLEPVTLTVTFSMVL